MKYYNLLINQWSLSFSSILKSSHLCINLLGKIFDQWLLPRLLTSISAQPRMWRPLDNLTPPPQQGSNLWPQDSESCALTLAPLPLYWRGSHHLFLRMIQWSTGAPLNNLHILMQRIVTVMFNLIIKVNQSDKLWKCYQPWCCQLQILYNVLQ